MPVALFIVLISCGVLQAEETNQVSALPKPIISFHKASTGDECNLRVGDLVGGLKAGAYDVGHVWRMYIVPCNMGVYQLRSAVYAAKADNAEIARMLFVTWDEGLAATDVLADVQYEPKTHILSSFHRFRGLGDCGTLGKYEVLADENGVRPKVLEIRHKEKCDGEYTKLYPRVFP